MHVLPFQPAQLDLEEQQGAPPVDFLPVEAPPKPEAIQKQARTFLQKHFLDRAQDLQPPPAAHVITVRRLTIHLCVVPQSMGLKASEQTAVPGALTPMVLKPYCRGYVPMSELHAGMIRSGPAAITVRVRALLAAKAPLERWDHFRKCTQQCGVMPGGSHLFWMSTWLA